MNIFDTTISAFASAQDTKPADVTLRQFLFSTRHAEKIEALRAEADKEKRDHMKKNLPAATISGTFERRAIAGIRHYNGLVCLDFDAKENPGFAPADMKRILADFDEVAYAARSVGGLGVFAIVPTDCEDPQEHGGVVDCLGQLLRQHAGLTYDRSCKDVSRLRFVSHDPDAYLNPEPETFRIQHLFQAPQQVIRPSRTMNFRQTETTDRSSTQAKVEALLDALDASCCDVTDCYDDWLRLGFALASEFGAAGETYFQRLSQWSPKYDHHATEKKFSELLRNGQRVRIGTFFTILRNAGITLQAR